MAGSRGKHGGLGQCRLVAARPGSFRVASPQRDEISIGSRANGKLDGSDRLREVTFLLADHTARTLSREAKHDAVSRGLPLRFRGRRGTLRVYYIKTRVADSTVGQHVC